MIDVSTVTEDPRNVLLKLVNDANKTDLTFTDVLMADPKAVDANGATSMDLVPQLDGRYSVHGGPVTITYKRVAVADYPQPEKLDIKATSDTTIAELRTHILSMFKIPEEYASIYEVKGDIPAKGKIQPGDTFTLTLAAVYDYRYTFDNGGQVITITWDGVMFKDYLKNTTLQGFAKAGEFNHTVNNPAECKYERIYGGDDSDCRQIDCFKPFGKIIDYLSDQNDKATSLIGGHYRWVKFIPDLPGLDFNYPMAISTGIGFTTPNGAVTIGPIVFLTAPDSYNTVYIGIKDGDKFITLMPDDPPYDLEGSICVVGKTIYAYGYRDAAGRTPVCYYMNDVQYAEFKEAFTTGIELGDKETGRVYAPNLKIYQGANILETYLPKTLANYV